MDAGDSARERAEAWVRAQGWRIGPNADGSIVSIGTAPYDTRVARLQLALSLSTELACLNARNELATYLAAEISATSASTQRVTGSLASSTIDRIAQGTDARASSTFRDAVWVSARCELSALLPVTRFMTTGEEQTGIVAVVMRHDAGSAAAASSMAAGATIDAPPGAPAAEAWLADLSATEAMESIGPKLLRDRNGKLVMAAFGYADLLPEPQAQAKAEERASIAAESALRNFMGQAQSGRTVLERTSTLTELAAQRSAFESTESMMRWVESTAEHIRLPPRYRAKSWTVSSAGRGSSVAVVLLTRTDSGSAGPIDRSVVISGPIIRGEASGIGVFQPRTDADRALHPILKKSRALRAAVINAKAMLARNASAVIATSLRERSDESRVEAQQRTEVTVQRALLAAASLVRAEYAGTDDAPECRAWIEATTRINPTPAEAAGCGLPVFTTEQEAAAAIAGWTLRGLCDQAIVRVLVRQGDALRIADFGVGLGFGAAGDRVASAKALSSLTSAVSETIQASDTLSREMLIEDPLSSSGGRMHLTEALTTTRRRETASVVRIGGSVTVTSEDGLIATVCWPAPGR
jgi:hypothetical protein